MEPASSRLRLGEIVAGIGGVALLVVLFAVNWLTVGGQNRHGWNAVPVLRWVVVITALGAIALTITQAAMRSPALPVSLSVIVTVLGGLCTLLILIRLLTTSAGTCAGIFIALAAAALIAFGGYQSLRREQGWRAGPGRPVETVALGRR